MKKLIFFNVPSFVGVVIIVIVSSLVGAFLLNEVRSFVEPTAGPGAAGSLSQDVGGRSVLWAGYTPIGYIGDLGGLKGANQKCEDAFAGSHWASYEEIMQLGAKYPWTEQVWVRDAIVSKGYDSPSWNISMKDSAIVNTPNNPPFTPCSGWTSGTNSYSGVIMGGSGLGVALTCDLVFKLACVY